MFSCHNLACVFVHPSDDRDVFLAFQIEIILQANFRNSQFSLEGQTPTTIRNVGFFATSTVSLTIVHHDYFHHFHLMFSQMVAVGTPEIGTTYFLPISHSVSLSHGTRLDSVEIESKSKAKGSVGPPLDHDVDGKNVPERGVDVSSLGGKRGGETPTSVHKIESVDEPRR